MAKDAKQIAGQWAAASQLLCSGLNARFLGSDRVETARRSRPIRVGVTRVAERLGIRSYKLQPPARCEEC